MCQWGGTNLALVAEMGMVSFRCSNCIIQGGGGGGGGRWDNELGLLWRGVVWCGVVWCAVAGLESPPVAVGWCGDVRCGAVRGVQHLWIYMEVLCCVVLCCVVLCCVVLCCVALCCVVLCCVVLCCVVLCCVVLCCVVLCCVVLCCVVLCCVVLCCVVLCSGDAVCRVQPMTQPSALAAEAVSIGEWQKFLFFRR